ncbi:MAG: 50S ribosomal protein L17 [Alphaproteobacteria bacterium]|jgi:large subunit ribosomal protein L17|nr:50S ribosomal protein L17 [Candidatus Jidaibacter sp.]
MDHGIKGRKFGRRTAHRQAMFMNLVKSLIQHGRIFTTLPKAKDLRPIAEKIITLGKQGDLSSRRQVISFMRGDCAEVKKLFSEVAGKVKDRNGGYLRILKAGHRQGDNAPMAMIEFVDQ